MDGDSSGRSPRPGSAEIRITPDDVGRRVSVRRIVGAGGGRPVFSDAVGVLESWDAGELLVRRRDGSAVVCAERALVAGKVVPDPPVRRAGRRSGD